jgi:hypothetical protein
MRTGATHIESLNPSFDPEDVMRSIFLPAALLFLSACTAPLTPQFIDQAHIAFNDVVNAAAPYCDNYRCRQANLTTTTEPEGALTKVRVDSTIVVTPSITGYVASPSELAAAIAHEYGHLVFRHHDTPKAQRVWLTQETQADCASYFILRRTSYDPSAVLSLISKIKSGRDRIAPLARLASIPTPSTHAELAQACDVPLTSAATR